MNTRAASSLNYFGAFLAVLLSVLLTVVSSAPVYAHDSTDAKQSEPSSTLHETNGVLKITRGQNVYLQYEVLCLSAGLSEKHCEEAEHSINKLPVEGVIFQVKNSEADFRYQHGGSSAVDDGFIVQSDTSDSTLEFGIVIKVANEKPKLIVHSPKAGDIVVGDSLEVKFEVIGAGADHVHIAIQDGEHLSIPVDLGSYTLRGLTKGSHLLQISIASQNHKTIPGSLITIPVEVQ